MTGTALGRANPLYTDPVESVEQINTYLRKAGCATRLGFASKNGVVTSLAHRSDIGELICKIPNTDCIDTRANYIKTLLRAFND